MVPLILVMLVTEWLTRRPTSTASEHAAERQRLAETSRRNAETLTAMGMFGSFGERWAKANDL